MVRRKPTPKNALSDVKSRVRAGDIVINPDVLQDAYDAFGWWDTEIKQCLLNLNGRYYFDDRQKNHFYKSDPHKRYPTENTYIDFYRASKILQNENVYTHLYIRENTTTVTVNSFKEL